MQSPDRQNDGPMRQRTDPNGQGPRPSFWRRNFAWLILVLLIPWILYLFFQPGSSSGEQVSYSQFITQVQNGNVKSVTLNNNSVTGTFNTPVHSDVNNQTNTKFNTVVPNLTSEQTIPALTKAKVQIIANPSGTNLWLSALINFLPF
ncbi:MAG TPA: ATP-dependent metallopeptidase FtsH/Yme1/Tma family protein, partial [Ktedonobacterales bacterium]|nr:ATP-dependent metallopeptidase FtsH/Yme1/Tma family protein [Ktedonobacterales bacterium]